MRHQSLKRGSAPYPMSEASAQSMIRLAAPSHGWALLRNNSGAATDANGRTVRYGLGNDSAKINAVFKSADLIGIRRVVITPNMVGQVIGQFAAVEVKAPGWRLTPGDKRAQAQAKFGEWVTTRGGVFVFATGPDDVPW